MACNVDDFHQPQVVVVVPTVIRIWMRQGKSVVSVS